MKATKFRKYEPAISAIRQSVESLAARSEEIDEILANIKNLNIVEIPVPEGEKGNSTDYGFYQRSFDISLSHTNICSTLYEHCQEKRFESRSNIPNNNYNIEVQTFLSITHFLGANEIAPSHAKLEDDCLIEARHSKMSI